MGCRIFLPWINFGKIKFNQIINWGKMLESLDETIEINLKMLSEQKNHWLFRTEFVSKQGNPLIDSKRFVQLMVEKGLVSTRNERCDLTEKGLRIVKNGGWLKFVSELEVAKQTSIGQKLSVESLDFELKQLQKESLEYAKTIRDQESRIRDLTEQLRFINLIRQYWWFIGACITLGFLIGKWLM